MSGKVSFVRNSSGDFEQLIAHAVHRSATSTPLATANGVRSGKRRLRQIDSRIRFLTKRIDAAEVVDPKKGPGDRVVLHAPAGNEQLQILDVRYGRIPVAPFREPPGAEAAPRA